MGTAFKTFEKAQARASYLCKLADGLVNTRKRAMRTDWAKNFLKMMRWKADGKINRVDGRDAVVVLRPGTKLSVEDFDSTAVSDLYRAALVMSVSAMDAYFHAKVLRYVVTNIKKNEPSKSLLNLKITVEDFIKGDAKKRRNSVLRSSIGRSLSFQTFQSPDKIASALTLIGVKDMWSKVAKELNVDETILKKSIEKIVHRRNKIAHEGDVSQSNKARNADRRIHPNEVTEALDLISRMVGAAEKVINAEVK